jgi:uncharacterized Zn finger protein (UPF0148 family)
VSEAVIRCPKCGEKLRVTIATAPEQPSKPEEVTEQIKVSAQTVSSPKVELAVEAIDWKPWKRGTGEWAGMQDAMGLFMKIQSAGGRLEHGGYSYWIFGRNRDMIARKKIRD